MALAWKRPVPAAAGAPSAALDRATGLRPIKRLRRPRAAVSRSQRGEGEEEKGRSESGGDEGNVVDGWYSIARLREHNPHIDTEQGPRAYLVPGNYGREQWDSLVESMVTGTRPANGGGGIPFERAGAAPPSMRTLRFYTTDWRPSLVGAAVRAGFFPYASAFEFPGKPFEERCLLNLEVSGARRQKTSSDPGGRVILDDIRKLRVGKKTLKIAKKNLFVLTCSRDMENVLRMIVSKHGVDWMGFRRVGKLLLGLPRLETTSRNQILPTDNSNHIGMRIVAFELKEKKAGDSHPVSAEIGYIVGSCYTCLSVFSDTKRYPRCDRIRTQAVILSLARSGIRLFDAGVTANYYQELYGFRKVGKREFVTLWRRYRNEPLKGITDLYVGNDQLYQMLQDQRNVQLNISLVDSRKMLVG